MQPDFPFRKRLWKSGLLCETCPFLQCLRVFKALCGLSESHLPCPVCSIHLERPSRHHPSPVMSSIQQAPASHPQEPEGPHASVGLSLSNIASRVAVTLGSLSSSMNYQQNVKSLSKHEDPSQVSARDPILRSIAC